MLANYLSYYANDPMINSSAIISAPFNLSSCSDRISKGFSKNYQTYLLRTLKQNAINKLDILSHHLPISRAQITSIKTLREFDNILTAPLHGFKNADDYYQQCSALPNIDSISIPTFILHAKDDPFMNNDVHLTSSLPKNITYSLSSYGGHVGFVEKRNGKLNLWLEYYLPLYFDGQLNNT